eukprot:SAG31_NODE_2477_length_5637_cov_10.057241_6_plen_147_part_00
MQTKVWMHLSWSNFFAKFSFPKFSFPKTVECTCGCAPPPAGHPGRRRFPFIWRRRAAACRPLIVTYNPTAPPATHHHRPLAANHHCRPSQTPIAAAADCHNRRLPPAAADCRPQPPIAARPGRLPPATADCRPPPPIAVFSLSGTV